MAQLKSTKVFGDLNVTGEVNASTKITVNGEEVWDTGNLLNIGTTAATARTALGLGDAATRWPTFAEVTGKPATYAPSGHTHPWTQVTGQPDTATRWPTFAEVTGKPTNYPTTWDSVAAKPAQATRWPSTTEVTGLTTALDAKANTSTQVIAGTGLTGGGDLTDNRTLNVSYGTTAGTSVQGNDTRVVNAVPNSRTITTGTGLSGGGDLTANRTLNVSYGTAAGTAAQGNDVRISNGQTAFGWGSHASAGYAKTKADVGLSGIPNTNASTANFLRGDGTWVTPPNTNTTYAEITDAEIDAGTASTLRTISGRRMKYALDKKSDTGHSHLIGDVTGLQAAIDSKANTSTQVMAGTGLSGGGTLAANRTLTVSYGTTAGTAAQGNDSRIVNAVPNSRTVTAGTGLTGGGDLTANRTLAVTYGTAAGTSAQGNDSRITGALQASQVAQVTGTSTTSVMSQKVTTDQLATKAASSHTHPWAQVTGQPVTATRWPTFDEVTGKPTSYTPSSHTHTWAQVTGQPATATRWPTLAEVTGKPTNYPTNWATVSDKPIVQTVGTSTTNIMSQKAVTDALGAVGQPTMTGSATLNGTTDNTIALTGIVSALALESGDVIQITGSTGGLNDKLFTVESNTDDNSIIVNYEHAGNRGNGSLRLADQTATVTITRIAKWYNAPLGLGQAWVVVTPLRANGATYTNTSGRGVQLFSSLALSNIGNFSFFVTIAGLKSSGTLGAYPVVNAGDTYKFDWAGGISGVSFWELR